MALISVSDAARLTGRNRSTIIRAIEKGHLSAGRDSFGRYEIDPAELERVYGTLRSPDARDDAEHHDASESNAATMVREVELLREMLTQERDERQRERADHERERRTWEEERAFMRTLLERNTEQIKLLADQRERTKGRRWWQRWRWSE